ncbi:MAG: alpha/beta hydrolase [Chitinophagaceae bacterium]
MKKLVILLTLLVFFSLPAFCGKVDTVMIYSAAMHKNIPCVVIRPDDYLTAHHRFPVVYLLHGYSDNYSGWVTKVPEIKKDADLYQMILVCPDGGYSSWYLDSPVDSTFRYETYIALEVPAYIDSHYRTIADRMHRAITGLSMGGAGALYLAIRHKDFFGAAGSMSGGVDIRPFPNNWDLKLRLGDMKTHPENWGKNSVINVVDSLKNGELRIIFDCGVSDFFYQVNEQLHQKLLRMGIDHDYIQRPGHHSWAYWSNSIGYQLLFFSKFFHGENQIGKD